MFQALYENYVDASLNSNPTVQELQQNIIRYNNVEPNLIQVNNSAGYLFPNSTKPLNRNQVATINSIMNTTSNNAFGTTTFPAVEFAPQILTGPKDNLKTDLNNCRNFTGFVGLSNLSIIFRYTYAYEIKYFRSGYTILNAS